MKPDVSLIPELDRSVVERKPLTKKQRAMLALEQGGLCGCGCGVKLDHPGEGTIDEHLDPLGLTGTNDLINRSIWRNPCSAAKTKGDLGDIARAKRRSGETGQRARRERRQAAEEERGAPMKPKAKIASRGFLKGQKREWPKRSFR